jgi:hypothetical protein
MADLPSGMELRRKERTPDEGTANIYESDEEDNNKSGSPNLTRSLIQATGCKLLIDDSTEAGSKVDLELGKQKSEKTSDMGFYELEEKYLHYKRTSGQYEGLYVEYLEKFILCDRDKKLLIHKQKRVNALISQTAGCQAKWDAMSMEERKVALAVSGAMSVLFLIYLVA